MPRRNQNIITSRKGINFLRNIVEEAGSIFNEIHQENDVGIDAIIELFSSQIPTNKLVAFQVKTGSTYYDSKNDFCLIPVENHYDYWLNYSIPVYGLVFVPSVSIAFWVDIKSYLKKNGKVSVIKFRPKTINTFSNNYFINVFMKLVSNEIPNISFDEATDLLSSKHQDEISIGLTVLFKKYANRNESWNFLINFFKVTEVDKIPAVITYYFAHIPWHSDIFYKNESYTDESKKYAKMLISQFNENELVKLISFIDEDNLIARGTPGQNVKAITSIIYDVNSKLKRIIENIDLPLHIRAVAALLYAYNRGPNIDYIKSLFKEDEPWFIPVMLDTILEDPNFMPF